MFKSEISSLTQCWKYCYINKIKGFYPIKQHACRE